MPQNLTPKEGQFCARCVQAAEALVAAYNDLRQLRAEWTAEGYSTGITQAVIDANASPPPVVAGVAVPVAHLTPGVLGNLMSTFDVIDSLINSNTGGLQGQTGYLTNLYALDQ